MMGKDPHFGRDEGACRLSLNRLVWLPVPAAVLAPAALPAVDWWTNESEGAGS